MDKDIQKSYNSSEWLKLKSAILRRDNYKCQKCQKTEDDGVVLQVHHINYLPNHKAYEYDQAQLITLCQGCHAEEHGQIIPQSGWTWIDSEDLGELGGKCDYCGKENHLRYWHEIFHEKWGYIHVGSQCCDKLTASGKGSEQEKELKTKANAQIKFLQSPKWRHYKNGYFIDYKKEYHIEIWDNTTHFTIVVKYDKTNDFGKIEKTIPLRSSVKYETLERAKIAIFNAIYDRKVIRWIIKQETGIDYFN